MSFNHPSPSLANHCHSNYHLTFPLHIISQVVQGFVFKARVKNKMSREDSDENGEGGQRLGDHKERVGEKKCLSL